MEHIKEILNKEHLAENSKQQEGEVIDFNNAVEVDRLLKSQFDNICPTDIDFYKGKLYAYRIAAERHKAEQEEKRKKERVEQFTRPWTTEQMKRIALKRGEEIGKNEGFEFIIDEHNEKAFNLLSMYFSNDPQFEQHSEFGVPYSLNKGIWLQSDVRGTGKSILLKAFQYNKRSCFGYKHTTELATLFQKKGFEAIDDFIGTLPQPPSPINFYQTEIGFMYDELFGEDKVNHMGSPLLVSGYIINKLYDFSNNNRGKKFKFHCTSNADGKCIEDIAGRNYRSRMPDMFNLIKLDGVDRRK